MKILIVDDHPMIASFYESALQGHFHKMLNVIKVYNCKDAYSEIIDSQADYTIAIVDYSLPPYPEKKINSGVDIANLIRKTNSSCKIILITGYDKKLLLYDILRQTRPEGIVVKSDLSLENLIPIITEVLDGNQYQSPTVKQIIADIWETKILAEEINREILINLFKGYKISELKLVIPLAEITIRKRLDMIKKAFQIDKDGNLLIEISKKGFL